MPIYLAHGFRWPRDGFTGIRVHAIIHNLEPVSVEYIQNAPSRLSLLSSLRTLFPDIMTRLEKSGARVDFLEQYDPNDTSPNAVTQPYAFVCDRIAMIAGGENAEDHLNDLFQTQASHAAKEARKKPDSASSNPSSTESGPKSSSPERTATAPPLKKPRARTMPMSIEKPFNSPPDIRALSANLHDTTTDKPISPDAWDALAELRDQLAKDEKIGWWVVYNGDPVRAFDPSDDEDYDDDSEDTEMGESVEEGIKELRPVVSTARAQTPKAPTLSTALPLRESRPSNEEKEVHVGPVKHNTVTYVKDPSSTSSAVRSPTGGRIPPPVPPPSKKTRSPIKSQESNPNPQAATNGRDKELPPSPADHQRSNTQSGADLSRTVTREKDGVRREGLRKPSPADFRRMNSQVESDPSRAIAKEKDSVRREGLRKKFFGKKSG
ncbi:uncharacterized protein HMPREF1541_03151 [Cyphellophora europaea CBS 101466]|uniref:Uncharacterized protein n=1 Tax=Cyphellophora europaea (strain CBS 101466) TaxID=1220924 RepID=W2RXG5_CYPE1|nr:uncharacterized protein HMPREF1541_03151 [Cyphellophora europaea CBS 101466]ETN41216.1 hypothetical protein HMPREF1541_03151 [Cyphellophora europaea CBS 101466]